MARSGQESVARRLHILSIAPVTDLGSDDTLAATRTGARGRRPSPVRADVQPERVGRFLVLHKLGSGGMGAVYSALDPQLERIVAVKLVRTVPDSGIDTSGRARLLREARAMARLAHPNVLPVFEAGMHDNGVFIAMELVKGRNLREWLADAPRTWEEIVEVFEQAARGLGAAHAAGLVHRDFKPDNVMVGHDGRVRVMDFGLVCDADESSTEAPRKPTPMPDEDDPRITLTGAVLGTPAYMSREQHAGEATDPRTDQFSFCVALWEALYGERPYAGKTFGELAAAILDDRRRPVPSGTAVPGWLRQLCERGLARRPADRFADMGELLEAFAAGRTRRRSLRLVLTGAAMALIGLCVPAFTQWSEHRAVTACEDAAATEIEDAWNETTRARAAEGLRISGGVLATQAIDAALPRLDDYAGQWQDIRAQACADAKLDDEADPAKVERIEWCLEEQRASLAAFARSLEHADAPAANNALGVTVELDPPSRCLDKAVFRQVEPPPPQRREHLTQLSTIVARVHTLRFAGRYAEGHALAIRALEHASALGWAPAISLARRKVASFLELAGDYEAATREYEVAYFGSLRAGDFEGAAWAAMTLSKLLAQQLELEEAQRWSLHAEAAQRLLGVEVDDLEQAHYAQSLGILRNAEDDRHGSLASFVEAYRIFLAELGPDHPSTVRAMGNVAAGYYRIGHWDQGLTLAEEGVRRSEALYGPKHPTVAWHLEALAAMLRQKGMLEESAEAHARALAIQEATFGRDHPDVALTASNLGMVLLDLDRDELALQHLEHALAAAEGTYGTSHPLLLKTLRSLARARINVDDSEGAQNAMRRAIEIATERYGPEDPRVADLMFELGVTFAALGDSEQAVEILRETLQLRRTILGSKHPDFAWTLSALGHATLDSGRPERALVHLEAAMKLLRTHYGPEHHRVQRTSEVLERARAALAE